MATRLNAKNGPGFDPENVPVLGIVEQAVADTLLDVPPRSESHAILVATALTLARKLDDGAGLATAAVARELRCTVDVITKRDDGGEDDELHDFVSRLSSPMGNPAFS